MDTAPDQKSAILAALAAAAAPLPLPDIEMALAQKLSRRTVIRRLSELVAEGRVRKSGTKRSAAYALPEPAQQAAPHRLPARSTPQEADQDTGEIPLSLGGVDVIQKLELPPTRRPPVGYNRDFLERYVPNHTAYLSPDDRKRLTLLGQTPGPEAGAGTYAQQMLDRLLIDLSWNSSRLEGNTYSLLETGRLIALGEVADGKASRDAQMILNHKAAIEFLVQAAAETGFDRRTILNVHALLADNLLEDPGAPGRLRREAVRIGGSVFHPLEVPQLIEECFDTLLAKARAIADPFEQAFFVMVQVPYLQPFIDVNKRVSRLAANIPLIRANLVPLSFVAVPEPLYTRGILGVYELNRIDLLKDVFLWAYERSAARYQALRQSLGEPDAFRFRYRVLLKAIVADVIKKGLDQGAAARFIAGWVGANGIPGSDTARFIETAESELLGLHEGNFARYAVRPSEFDAWYAVWTRKR